MSHVRRKVAGRLSKEVRTFGEALRERSLN